MKILLFANTDWYLYNFRVSLANALRDQGHDVVLVSPPGPYGEKLRAAGHRWLDVPMNRRSLNPFQELLVLRHLVRLYRDERPDVVHHFTIKCVVYGGIAAAVAGIGARVNAVAGLGYVFTNQSLKARVLKPIVRRMLRLVLNNNKTRLILQNPDDVALFKSNHIIGDKNVRLIRSSGVDTEYFQIDKTALFAGPKSRVLMAARLLWAKGIAEYVDAARQLHNENLPIDFYLAGQPDEGNPNSVSQADLDDWNREGVIIPLGHVADMKQQYKQTDIFVLPTFYGEGVPRSLIEAGACGLPLITTDAPGCREVVTDELNGLVVPVRDADALALAIRRLNEAPIWARQLGEAAREKVLAEFDEQIVIERTLAVYEELLPRQNYC